VYIRSALRISRSFKSCTTLQILTKEIQMLSIAKRVFAVAALAGLLTLAVSVRINRVSAQAAPAPQPVPATHTQAVTPIAPKVAAGTPEAVKLLRLMDTDQNGKVSRAEYMAFMAAEFDRLDVNHDGELDVKELENSQFAVAHHGGTRR